MGKSVKLWERNYRAAIKIVKAKIRKPLHVDVRRGSGGGGDCILLIYALHGDVQTDSGRSNLLSETNKQKVK